MLSYSVQHYEPMSAKRRFVGNISASDIWFPLSPAVVARAALPASAAGERVSLLLP
jgi:hypothetical protein